jgi:ATP/maltotriose-dependent transcriptional regulator MalT
MEAQRMRELQLRLERERVRKQLAEVDREQLKSLEEDKKRFLMFSLCCRSDSQQTQF